MSTFLAIYGLDTEEHSSMGGILIIGFPNFGNEWKLKALAGNPAPLVEILFHNRHTYFSINNLSLCKTWMHLYVPWTHFTVKFRRSLRTFHFITDDNHLGNNKRKYCEENSQYSTDASSFFMPCGGRVSRGNHSAIKYEETKAVVAWCSTFNVYISHYISFEATFFSDHYRLLGEDDKITTKVWWSMLVRLQAI